ncbi:thiamine phosphate synthase, partial [bacterium]|nr:thiamine phosphate synthase [Candidatus Omnitrophota bacterium]MBU4123592.1 thiamine phosphate synthase [bacterium]
IGLSTHSLEQVEKANCLDVDYIGFGPIFPTLTKDYSIGTKDIPKALEISNKPVVFIGGINISNAEAILEMGAKNIAVIRAVAEAENIERRVGEFKAMMGKYRVYEN